MKVEIPLRVGSVSAALCIDVPGSVLNCSECARAFGISCKQVRADCLSGKLNAEHIRGGWKISVQSAIALYLSEIISDSAQVAAEIAKTSRTNRTKK